MTLPPLPHLSPPQHDGRIKISPLVQLAYVDRGAGQAIILIPGWGFTKEIFEKQIAFLAQIYRVIAYDPRSQGASAFSWDGNDQVTHAEDLAVLIDRLKIIRPVLVGWGTGAHTAWSYVKSYGADAIAGNVTITMPPKCLADDSDAWTTGTLEEMGAVHTEYLRDAKGVANYIRQQIETVLVQRNLAPEELAWLLAQSAGLKPLIAAQLFAASMFADHTGTAIALSRVRPTLFFIAQDAANRAIPAIKRLLPEARHVVFGGGMMFWEHPEAFNLVLDEFIREQFAASRTKDPVAFEGF